jgi:small-conductance mechanosensitive channel
MILPNSQIARLRITNYSAPKPQFRSQINVTLDHTMPVSKAREVLLGALSEAKLIQEDPAPDVRVRSYEEGGITYAVRYWLSRFDREVDCRDEVYSLIDDALRRAGTIAPRRRIELVQGDPFLRTRALAVAESLVLPDNLGAASEGRSIASS